MAMTDDEIIREGEKLNVANPLQAAYFLATIATECADISTVYGGLKFAKDVVQKDRDGIHSKLQQAVTEKTLDVIRQISWLNAKPPTIPQADNIHYLAHAYSMDYIGNSADVLLEYICGIDPTNLYCQSISVVQSSGSGESRLFTELGRQVFTLPICLRPEHEAGWPPGDKEVRSYLLGSPNSSDHVETHLTIGVFLIAAYETLASRLANLKANLTDNTTLLKAWHSHMEPVADPQFTYRSDFYRDVVKEARDKYQALSAGMKEYEPENGREFNDAVISPDIIEAHNLLEAFIQTEDMHKLCVVYFDEASILSERLWAMQRVLSSVNSGPKAHSVWHAFMATKSKVSYFTPASSELNSDKLRKESSIILPPYVSLDFDQFIRDSPHVTCVNMGLLRSLEHLSQYGRPMWKSFIEINLRRELLPTACRKLAKNFDPTNRADVLALFAHLICVEPVMTSPDAIELADDSVANHMRLLLGPSRSRQFFYTYSPSEPILSIAAYELLRSNKTFLATSIDTFCNKLCKNGLIDKGLHGELAARLLYIIARDYACPERTTDGLLKPVKLLHFLEVLIGKGRLSGGSQRKQWAGWKKAFESHYINFTHFGETEQMLPEGPDDQLYANLWARGVALQCSFGQEALDMVFATYCGSVDDTAPFSPKNVSNCASQIKLKKAADYTAEPGLRRFGIARGSEPPPPWPVLILELGTASKFRESNSHILIQTPDASIPHAELLKKWQQSVDELTNYEKASLAAQSKMPLEQRPGKKDPELTRLKRTVLDARNALDSFNRYTISIRGCSDEQYDVLKVAGVATQFKSLVELTTQSLHSPVSAVQHMQPLRSLDESKAYGSWRRRYVDVNIEVSHGEEMDIT